MASQLQPTTPQQSQSDKRAKVTKTEKLFLFIIGIFLVISLTVNVLHHYDVSKNLHLKKEYHPHMAKEIKPLKKANNKKSKTSDKDLVPKTPTKAKPGKKVAATSGNKGDDGKDSEADMHTLGGLSCAKFGGPSDEAASEMVYWHDIPSDSEYVSPFKRDDTVQYMTFEPDGGGWNNIRMAMETVVVLAHAMGRTLVLPPAQGMYLLGKDRGKQNTKFSFADFFHLESLQNEHSGLDIISTEEFLLREAMTGHLRNKTSNEISFPPGNRTDWDGEDPKPLKEWLREVTHTPFWKPGNCLAAFPATDKLGEAEHLHEMVASLSKEGGKNKLDKKYLDNPTPVDGETKDRMREALAGRKELCIYDHEMQAEPVIHFMCYHKLRVRLLTHFYSFIFFEDWKQQLWTNRFVRDHLRYLDELQCTAARVVEKLRSIAREEGNADGKFDSWHVRRGDFQYKETRVDADVLLSESNAYMVPKATLYIATDERNKDFFNPVKEHYNVYFLDDFKDLFKGMNTNYYGMLDQLIASKGRIFFGTYFSTFTGYVNRMRGYSSTKFNLEGGKNGTIPSYYFVPEKRKEEMTQYRALRGPFYAREFPTSWYDIDKDVTMSI
mmetsp:Transcript_5558/g.7106  ORF Transcript_5558/g.7106 Transcript_5558/m.7106 type:complete len:608 (+) Transcript_5558:254-2077(+)